MAEIIPATQRTLKNPRSEDGHGSIALNPTHVTLVQGTPGNPPVQVALSPTLTTEVYTGVGPGITQDVSAFPHKYFTLQVVGTGAPATAWEVSIEGSLNGTHFSEIARHTDLDGDGAVLWAGANVAASSFFRTRVIALTLGPATNIVVDSLGIQ
jgi:hypothetical protein